MQRNVCHLQQNVTILYVPFATIVHFINDTNRIACHCTLFKMRMAQNRISSICCYFVYHSNWHNTILWVKKEIYIYIHMYEHAAMAASTNLVRLCCLQCCAKELLSSAADMSIVILTIDFCGNIDISLESWKMLKKINFDAVRKLLQEKIVPLWEAIVVSRNWFSVLLNTDCFVVFLLSRRMIWIIKQKKA